MNATVNTFHLIFSTVMLVAIFCVAMTVLYVLVCWRHWMTHLKAVVYHDKIAEMQKELLLLSQDRDRLSNAVAHHRNMRGRCANVKNDNDLYAACGLEPARVLSMSLVKALASQSDTEGANCEVCRSTYDPAVAPAATVAPGQGGERPEELRRQE